MSEINCHSKIDNIQQRILLYIVFWPSFSLGNNCDYMCVQMALLENMLWIYCIKMSCFVIKTVVQHF